MNLSANGAALIAEHEGKLNELYDDPAGHCTIGIGHLVHRGNCNGSEPAEFQRGLSDQEVYDLFIIDAQRFVRAVAEMVEVPLTQNQFDALVSFAFNVGEGALAESTLLRKLNAGDYIGAADEFGKWVKADGEVLPGLVSRRAAERALFLKEDGLAADLEHLHPEFRRRVQATGVRVYSGARSTMRQGQLYQDYLAGRGNPANPPGTSWHEFGPGIPGGEWAMAVDFEEPYPHGAPGLCFPVSSEPWHAQPAEITESARVAGAENRLALPAAPKITKELAGMEFTYKFGGEDYVFLGVEGFHGHLPYGSLLDGLKRTKLMHDFDNVDQEFHTGVTELANQLGFIGDV